MMRLRTSSSNYAKLVKLKFSNISNLTFLDPNERLGHENGTDDILDHQFLQNIQAVEDCENFQFENMVGEHFIDDVRHIQITDKLPY